MLFSSSNSSTTLESQAKYFALNKEDPSERDRNSSALEDWTDTEGQRGKKVARTCGRGSRALERSIFAILTITSFAFALHSQRNYSIWRDSARGSSREKSAPVPVRANILKYDTPQENFRLNLRDDLRYVTGFPHGGLTNQLMSMFKLVHLGQRLDRDAILPDLEADHGEGDHARYSDFFDLDYFSQQSGVALAEWRDVTTTIDQTTSTEQAQLGCWGHSKWYSAPLERYNTHTTFWPFPEALQNKWISYKERSISFAGIEVLNHDDNREWIDAQIAAGFGSVDNVTPSPPLPPPDQQLLCFQNLYYITDVKFSKGEVDRSDSIEELDPNGPVWKVGQYLRFSPRVDGLVDDILGSLLGDVHQPFIAIHIRQGDFVKYSWTSSDTTKIKEAYSRGLEELRTQLAPLPIMQGYDVQKLPILLATDSTDLVLLEELNQLSWKLIDHGKLETEKKYGGWYPGLLDSAILSRAVGLVGTHQSTFTYLAKRRIETWNGGTSIVVRV